MQKEKKKKEKKHYFTYHFAYSWPWMRELFLISLLALPNEKIYVKVSNQVPGTLPEINKYSFPLSFISSAHQALLWNIIKPRVSYKNSNLWNTN